MGGVSECCEIVIKVHPSIRMSVKRTKTMEKDELGKQSVHQEAMLRKKSMAEAVRAFYTSVYDVYCCAIFSSMVFAISMKSTKVQTSPIYRNRTLEHLPQSTEPRAVLGSKYVMAKPAQFVKLSER